MVSFGSVSTTRDFRQVYRSGRKGRRDGITVFALERQDEPGVRLALSVHRKVGGAVERNRLRRRLRAAFREHAADGRYDAVIRAEADAGRLSFQDLEVHVAGALTAAGVGADL